MAAKIKKVLLILFTVLLTVLVLCASWLAFDKHVLKHKVPTIFGYGYVAISLDAHSMSGVIEAGDLIIIKSCDEYKTGDIMHKNMGKICYKIRQKMKSKKRK